MGIDNKKSIKPVLMKRYFFVLLAVMASVLTGAAKPSKILLKEGLWKAVLQRPDGQEIIFNFETVKESGRQVIYVLNAEERLLVDSIRRSDDSIWIQMPFFASGFAARVKKDGNLQGLYLKNYGNRIQQIPFYTVYGSKERYPSSAKAKYNVSGRWAINFLGKTTDDSVAVGEFKQAANGKITGTLLAPSGDYRYLQGNINGDSLKLSAFDGGHAVLFSARIDKDSKTLSGGYLYSGLTISEKWVATKNASAKLNDGYDITRLREGESKLNFSFPSTKGDVVSINDERFKNKVVVLQILGSWCPNCMDETGFLSTYYKQHHQKGVEIIGLAYERTADFEESRKALQSFQKRFDVQYPFLITGAEVSDPKRTEKTLPQLEDIRAFPTTIFIDKKGNVRKIHSGYNGPATGAHYEEFKKEFDELINSLLQEG